MYKISIIIPIHNIESYLEETLDSLFNQTIGHENLEVLMINDCSTDRSLEIIDKYASKFYNFIAVHLTENSGLPGKPRNIGIEKATGEYLMFMDHDDYYSKDACEVFYNKIAQQNADIIFSRYNYVFDDGRRSKSPNYLGEINELNLNSIEENKSILDFAPSIWTKMFKRSFILDNNIRFPEGMLAEDLSFYVHSLLKAKGIIYLNNYFSYNYRIRDSDGEKSTIHIRNKKYLQAMIDGYYNTYDILKSLKKEDYFPVFFESHLNYWLYSFILSNAERQEKVQLLENSFLLFEKQRDYNLNLDEKYLPLVDNILNRNFDEAIDIAEVMADFQMELIAQKNRMSDLQTTSGWLKYKIENINQRIKKRI